MTINIYKKLVMDGTTENNLILEITKYANSFTKITVSDNIIEENDKWNILFTLYGDNLDEMLNNNGFILSEFELIHTVIIKEG